DESDRENVLIEVDGNVSFENAVKMRKAGADIFVCGSSSIFSKGATVEENIKKFRECVEIDYDKE
ncbi:MAG: ribulose-phosphate 3-epimerase, partial [Oscillospiraceae bacterium]|nr:ribulose-phosphate 3-epimerase [Oscillospiraceae bacterium]